MNERAPLTERTVELTRIFDAPPERVFAAWTEPRHLARWFGPAGFTVHSCEIEARPGGVFRLCTRSPEGKDYWVRGLYRELVPPRRLVIASTADDERGVPALEELVEVTLTDEDGRTRLALRATAAGASPQATLMLKGMGRMWNQTVEKLDKHLARRGPKDSA
jgi:uncharacterized protein YndB with AHSA1/START domain